MKIPTPIPEDPIIRMAWDFVGDSPPGFSGSAMAMALAEAKSSNRGNARRRAPKVCRYFFSSVCTLHRMNSSSSSEFFRLWWAKSW
jgi:hypothetical protein